MTSSSPPPSAKSAAMLNSNASITGKWFDSGICVDSMSSVSSILSQSSSSTISSRLAELELDAYPTQPEKDPQDARLIQELNANQIDLHTYLPDADGDT